MKTWAKILIHAVAAAAVIVLVTICNQQSRHIKTLKSETSNQQRVIDSLLTMERNSVDIELFVTDKSTNKIYGRYNKGTITMPSAKSYTLEVDSANIFKR